MSTLLMTGKTNVKELALFGGTPSFKDALHVGRPNVGNRDRLLRRFNEVLDRRWFTNNGTCVRELESAIASLHSVKHCIAMCNATIALEIAARALGMRGEVIIPSFTFIATAHSLQWQEITPVFCDIDPATHNIDPALIESMITPRTTGIIGVHTWGRPCETEAISTIARKHNLSLMFDAAHAFACSRGQQMIGGFGDAEVFSFHATKFFNTFEGGAVTTNNDDLADKIRLMRNFGFAGFDKVVYLGTNGKMNEMCAAMGLTSLEALGRFIEINKQNHDCYREELAAVPGLKIVDYPAANRSNYQYVVIEFDESAAGLNRDEVLSLLHRENVIARRYFYPGCHQMEPYRSLFPHSGLLLPHTNRLTQRVMSLPTGTAVTPEDITNICRIIRLGLENGPMVRDALSNTTGI